MRRLFALLLLLLPLPATADEFSDAVAAYADADYEKSLPVVATTGRKWRRGCNV